MLTLLALIICYIATLRKVVINYSYVGKNRESNCLLCLNARRPWFEYGLFIRVRSFHLGMVFSFGYGVLWSFHLGMVLAFVFDMVFLFGYGLFIWVGCVGIFGILFKLHGLNCTMRTIKIFLGFLRLFEFGSHIFLWERKRYAEVAHAFAHIVLRPFCGVSVGTQ